MPDDASPNANSIPKPNGSVVGPSSSGRSCVTCRRRKVKCDKNNPCSNCVRAKIECIFPGPGRAPRKSRKPADTELLERLRRLEGVVTSLNAQVEGHEQEAADREKGRQTSAGGDNCPRSPQQGADARGAARDSTEGLEHRFGRLVIENGRSRYVNNGFYASLSNEVEDLKAILMESSDEDDDDTYSHESSNAASQHQAFIFGHSSTNVDMRVLHPSEQLACDFWDTFKENVEPLVKILHLPTFEPIFHQAVAHLDKAGKGMETLLFVIYYGAVTSTSAADCISKWGEERSVLLNRYRFGVEQALARANFLYCDEIIILQSFVFFLLLLRRNDDARKIWTLTGLAVRIAQTLGIHRDGSHFGLLPFEIEMRRRLWWQVCILDARASEDHGCDPTIIEAQFDSKMPLNVNDTDLQPGMTEFPEERKGFTDMTFPLLRFEIATIFRRIFYIPPGPARCTEVFAGLTIQQKEEWISDCHKAMEEKYLKNCDMSIPLCWVTATLSRLIMSKMWLVVYHPSQRKDGGATLPQEIKDKLFITSIENIEYSILVETEVRTMKWSWLSRTFVQWHAIAFLLSELCVRTKGKAVERAWKALETTAGNWWFPLNDSSSDRKGQLWKPLRKLLAKAKAARERELALERATMAVGPGQLRNEQYQYVIDQMDLPPATASQQSPEALDSMLRPTGPKLGEMPVAEYPSWPESPGQPEIRSVGSGLSRQQPLPNTQPLSNGQPMRDTPGQDFGSLLQYGSFHNVITDVVSEPALDGTSFSNYASYSNPTVTLPLSQPTPATIPSQTFATNNVPTAANAYPMFGHGMPPATNMNFGATGNMEMTGTSLLNEESMDWALWDDMVSQYGTGDSSNSSNPASTTLVPWF